MKSIVKINLILVFLLVSTFAEAQNLSSVSNYRLKSNWQFKQSDSTKWYPATIPGCVHTDLMNNKLIENPFYGINEKKLQWIGKKDWDYRTEFSVPANVFNKKNINLIFNGLDTYADVYLNDSLILSANNMFRTWKISCKDLLKQKGNTLRIHFKNVFEVNLPKLKKAPYKLYDFPNNDQSDTMSAMYARKAQYEYGWDWGPRLITCGIWKEVVLQGWDNFKINNVQVIQKDVTAQQAKINSILNISSDVQKDVSVKLKIDDSLYVDKNVKLFKGENKIPINITINNPNLWWTNGLGTHYLYNFQFTVNSNNDIVDSCAQKIGVRSLKVVRKKDKFGKSFYVMLNGVPVFMKGANYIPQDNFLNRVSPKRYKHIIKSAADSHMNILRVWGGGIYENNEFYHLCDKYGILVWQEFMFACAMYPPDSAFVNNVKHEIIDNVTRLRNHSCIALYCGNNENEIAWYQWGWKNEFPDSTQKKYEKDMHRLFNEIIPQTLSTVDTTRYYHYTSPIAGFNGTDNSEGDIHYWGVWHGHQPFSSFHTNLARYVSEYGFQSYPEIDAIKQFCPPGKMQLHSDVMLSHQRCLANNRKDKEYGNRLINWYMNRNFKKPKDFDMFVYLSQVLQAEGDKIAINAHRMDMPYCMGSMYWQIDDCWPAASWSSIDYYGNWKALQYYVKKAYSTYSIVPSEKENKIKFYIISDSLQTISAKLELKVMDFSGDVIFKEIVPLNIEENSSKNYLTLFKDSFAKNIDTSHSVLIAKLKSNDKTLTTSTYFFTKFKNLNLEKPDIQISAKAVDNGYELDMTSNKYAKDVYLRCPKVKGFFSDNYFDLFPGKAKKIIFNTEHEIENIIKKLKVVSLFDSYKK